MNKKALVDDNWYPLQIKKGYAEQDRRRSFCIEIEKYEGKVRFTMDSSNYMYIFHNEYLYVDPSVLMQFANEFYYYINGNELQWDNLMNILFMVKDAGDDFRQVLTENLPYIDQWTILDTGSTDNTVQIIKDVLKHKKGKLYQEKFINFKESRNRLLELAGKSCVFNVMLDDTYVLHGDLRSFLTIVRGDNVADSFSLVITSSDIMYNSNRITKSERNLCYIYPIHEVIQTENNICIQIPYANAFIEDRTNTYMIQRTTNRKNNDLQILFEELETNPTDPRTLYYIATTYVCIKDWVNAYKYFEKRVEDKSGYKGEIQDSLYYIAVIAEFIFKA